MSKLPASDAKQPKCPRRGPRDYCEICDTTLPPKLPDLSEDVAKRLAFLRLSNEEKMRHCVFCGDKFGPNEAGHINCGGKLLDVKLPAPAEDGIATKAIGIREYVRLATGHAAGILESQDDLQFWGEDFFFEHEKDWELMTEAKKRILKRLEK